MNIRIMNQSVSLIIWEVATQFNMKELQIILSIIGILWIVDITWKIIKKEGQTKQETKEAEKIAKKYFGK